MNKFDNFLLWAFPLNKTDSFIVEFSELYNVDTTELKKHFVNERRSNAMWSIGIITIVFIYTVFGTYI